MTKTIACLLVTNDPDDFLEFSEALNEISDDAILVAVADTTRAIKLLQEKLQRPDFILINLSMYGGMPETFLKLLIDHDTLKRVPVVGYGASENLDGVKSRISQFLGEDFSYADLKKSLTALLRL